MGEVWIVRSVLLLWWLTWLGVVMWLTWLGVVMWLTWMGVVVMVMWWMMLKWLCCSPHYIAVARALRDSVSVKLPRLIYEHCWTSARAMDWSREQRLDWIREQWLGSLTIALDSLHFNLWLIE
jgi:hypothetical protein